MSLLKTSKQVQIRVWGSMFREGAEFGEAAAITELTAKRFQAFYSSQHPTLISSRFNG
jgi:hypothetical protein